MRYRALVLAAALSALEGLARAQSNHGTVPLPDNTESRSLACTGCHGKQGRGSQDDYFPSLAGKPAGYLYHQLVAFRDGRRKYPPMNYLLAYLPDAYLRELADYFAQQHLPSTTPPPPGVHAAVLAHGEALATQGDATRKIPPCISCHGKTLTGMEPGVPALLGLRARYISAQLGAWRYGTRTALAPDCMQQIAARLTDNDVTAVAAWLSSRPRPAVPRPAAAGSFAMPLACGSQAP